MPTSKMIALVLVILAIVLFVVKGFDLVESTKVDLVAIGLASWASGWCIHHYVNP